MHTLHLNEQNLPDLNLTVDDATRLKRSKPAQILKKARPVYFRAGRVSKKDYPFFWKL
jgi:hypothetical protein